MGARGPGWQAGGEASGAGPLKHQDSPVTLHIFRQQQEVLTPRKNWWMSPRARVGTRGLAFQVSDSRILAEADIEVIIK